MLGMGKSDKPDIEYRFFDHAKYVEGFIEKMKLKDITLVLHDWGSGLGFHYAMRNEDKIRGIAFMEALLSRGKKKARFEHERTSQTPSLSTAEQRRHY